jgi:hypothetical protein
MAMNAGNHRQYMILSAIPDEKNKGVSSSQHPKGEDINISKRPSYRNAITAANN